MVVSDDDEKGRRCGGCRGEVEEDLLRVPFALLVLLLRSTFLSSALPPPRIRKGTLVQEVVAIHLVVIAFFVSSWRISEFVPKGQDDTGRRVRWW